MHTASYEFLMKPKESAGCHQTLSARVGSGDETMVHQTVSPRERVGSGDETKWANKGTPPMDDFSVSVPGGIDMLGYLCILL